MMLDINCDVGEGLDNEKLLMPYISSCNISCGAHAGSIAVIDNVISLAKQYKVKIGAHPSFEDSENFGRKVLAISNDKLFSSLVSQLELFKQRAYLQHAKVNHVKPHGALYNLIAVNKEKAEVVASAIKTVFNEVKVFVPYQSVAADVARKRNMQIVYEVFADRNYNDDLTLVSRSNHNAIIHNPTEVLSHVKRIASKSEVKTITGKMISLRGETFCVHGDNENALQILKVLNEKFEVEHEI